MDVMDFRSKMASTLYVAAGAILGACVMFYVSGRRRSRKSIQENKMQNDALFSLQGELEEYRKSLDEVHQRLERETERRNESEAWSRKLESDLMDHVSARKQTEEKCFKLISDLEDTQRQLKESYAKSDQLEFELKDLRVARQSSQCNKINLIPNRPVNHKPQSFDPTPEVLKKTNVVAQNDIGSGPKVKTKKDVTNDVLSTLGEVIRGNDDIINDGVIETLQVKLLDQQTDKHLKDQYEQDEEYEVYREDEDEDDDESFSDEEDDFEKEDEVDDDDVERPLRTKRRGMNTSDDHFELGKDVMGALIANAFKDGVIASRVTGDPSEHEETGVNGHQQGNTPSDQCSGEKGEVSQESFDVKSARRFWEQMTANNHQNTYPDDDVTDEEDDVLDDESDIGDYDEEDFEDDLEDSQDEERGLLAGGNSKNIFRKHVPGIEECEQVNISHDSKPPINDGKDFNGDFAQDNNHIIGKEAVHINRGNEQKMQTS